MAGNIDIETRGALTEKIAALRRSVAAGQQVIGQTVHIGTEQTNALTMLLDTIDLLAELASQCASHTHPERARLCSLAGLRRRRQKQEQPGANTPLSLPE